MRLAEIAAELDLQPRSAQASLERAVTGGHVGDLLSAVMAQAKPGQVWVTVQVHPNIVAVAVLLGLAGIIVAANAEPEAGTLARAEAEGVPILCTGLGAFEAAGRLYELGVR